MIPENITRDHIIKAIEFIDQENVPSKRDSTKFLLRYNSKYYPPKYVVSIANNFANASILEPHEFSGGDETNKFLSGLGFAIVAKDLYSWKIISETLVEKLLDKSTFINHGTAIPHDLILFFNIKELVGGNRYDISLRYGETIYSARISIDNQQNPRGRLFWNADFDRVLQSKYPDLFKAMSDGAIDSQDWAKLTIKKTESDTIFEVSFTEIQPVDIDRAAILTNDQLCDRFKCSSQGGMRRAKRSNSLVLISDHTKTIYDDRWIDDEFHYTGMGLHGDQDVEFQQNKTLQLSQVNKVHVHLFEVFESGKYVYQGRVCLSQQPYEENQPDAKGQLRSVIVFPLKLVSGEEPVPIDQQAYNKLLAKRQRHLTQLTDEQLLEKAAKVPVQSSKRPTKTTTFERSPYISELAKRRAKGLCQLCGNTAPFENKDGNPYLESHHIVWLSKGGEDCISNTVALCPNCHTKMHVLNLKKDVRLLTRIAETEAVIRNGCGCSKLDRNTP